VNSRILLTGGTGFFGRALLRHYVSFGMASDSSVCVLSRDPQRFLNAYPEFTNCEGISFVQSDIEDRDSLPWDQTFTHVLHAATDSTVGPQLLPLQRFNQILNGTALILDLAVATGAKRFLLTSSGGIYGPQPSDLRSIPETWPGCPPLDQVSSAYSQAKRAAEHLCALYRDTHSLQTVVARCFAFVGPDLPLDVHFAIGNFIRDALFADSITVAGDGTPLRSYLDQRDLAHWLWTLLRFGHDGHVYNVGSDYAISIADLACLVRDLIAPAKSVHILGDDDPVSIRNRYIPNIDKIRLMHGLRVTIPLEHAISVMADSHR
jgi:UDP-glucuronate decarboxylase